MGRHAYLIMAHNHFDYLNKLLKSLDDPRNDIFIHIDKKAGFTDFQLLERGICDSKVYYIKPRDVKWAAFSGILCEMDLLKAATDRGYYDYYHLLSGSDLVIKTQNELHQFFDQHKGKEFVAFDEDPIENQYLDRVKYYYFFQDVYGRNRKNVFMLGLYAMDKMLLALQKLLRINRLKGIGTPFQKGANWFSITHDFALHVIKQEQWIKEIFRYSLSGDELFLQTILINSDFRQRLCQPQRLKDNLNMRLIDWNRGKPYIWRIEDLPILMNSDMFYARKIDPEIDHEIITMVTRNIIEK